MIERCRVVLVRTKFPGNLGAAARVMRNFGLSDLVLVSPEADRDDRQARQLSTHGEEILDRARIVGDLKTAVADCVLVAATSARVGGPYRRQSAGTLRQLMPAIASAAHDGPIALVFGPETNGLTDEGVAIAHYLLQIPTDETYPALNLGQAVAISLYELSMSLGNATQQMLSDAATHAEQDRMFEHLREALTDIHFLYGNSAGTLMHALRHLLSRSRLTKMEVDVLHGLARQIQWHARQRGSHITAGEVEQSDHRDNN